MLREANWPIEQIFEAYAAFVKTGDALNKTNNKQRTPQA